jgi:hypothetical protein
VADHEHARGQPFSVDERKLAHAALVYHIAYNARCERSHLLSGMGRAQVPE